METKKFIVNGCETDWCYLTYQDKINLIKDEKTTEEDKKFLVDKLMETIEYNLCPKRGENEDDVFVRFFSNFVNGRMNSTHKVAEGMARDHRYLQQQMFKVCLEYIKILAENADKGYYDGRNEWACTASKYMIDGLKMADYPY